MVVFFATIINSKFELARHPAGGNGNPGPDPWARPGITHAVFNIKFLKKPITYIQ